MAQTIAEKLNHSRQALLDLSARNRLLSLPARPSGKLMNIYDERTADVYRLLVSEEKSLTFLPGRVAPGEASEDLDDDEGGVAIPQPEDESIEVSGGAARHRDLRLQTKLTSERLQRRLLEMFYDARTFIEEQGVNILYLGLGQLKWIDAKGGGKERIAPLVMLPVGLERKSAAERFHLSWLQEDAAENLSLAAKLKADFGLVMPEFVGDDDFDPVAYIDRVTQCVASQAGWQVLPNAIVLGFFSFSKFLMYRDLDPANWPESQGIDKQPLIVATLQEGFPAKPPLFDDDVAIDSLISVQAQRHVVDADGSQTLAVEAVRKGEHLVIQGPPGTGKSQTITNVIAAALADGKKVLFVSEKMAALEVVYRRLNAIGLGPACLELHSNRSNKRHVLDELKATRDLGRPKVEQRDEIISQLESRRDALNKHASLMHEAHSPSGLSPYAVLGHLIGLSEVKLTGLPVLLDSAETWSGEEFRLQRERVREFVEKATKVGDAKHHPWRGVGHETVLRLDADEWIARASQLRPLIDDLVAQAALLGAQLGLQQARTLNELEAQVDTCRQFASAPPLDRVAIANTVWASGLRSLGQIVETGGRSEILRRSAAQKFVESAWQEDMTGHRREIAARGESMFRVLSGTYRHAIRSVKAHLKAPLPKEYKDRIALLDELIESQNLRKRVAGDEGDGVAAFGVFWKGEASDWEQLAAVVRWMSGANGQGRDDAVVALYSQVSAPQECVAAATAAASLMTQVRDAAGSVVQSYALNLEEAFSAKSLGDLRLSELAERVDLWQSDPDSLYAWVQYFSQRQVLFRNNLGELAKQFEQRNIAIEQLCVVFERAYYERVLRGINQTVPVLSTFDGQRHGNLIETFRTLDKRRIELARAEAALCHYEAIPRGTAGIGPMGILNGEIARRRGHMPLRKLFKHAGSAVQAIKPVFMMSPLSVAQFLEPGAVGFDLLVVDEASQIEPVDALGAIARCRQLVVVGDERQLPPTRFFSRMTSDETDADDDEVQAAGARDVESVLSLCIAKGVPQMMLRWHYRSRHQSLIAVSNQQFYENRLYIVPSPHTGLSGLGLRFNHVPAGVFDTGGTRVNREEAKVVASAVIRHAQTSAHQSLGIAAFSLQQKLAIQEEVEVLRRSHPQTEGFFAAHPNEPFFVKNLENVQGDERDVIFISVAYARNASGYLPMKFGPVGAEGGERRLNVLISRAKLRCEVFSSITADDIDLERAKGKGVAALKVFLGFAATGRLSLANTMPSETAFLVEREVQRALEKSGFTVHPQMGIAGFFIDLAVADAEDQGRYLLGIELDGESYSRARCARDRDRLRQSVLEDHGWILHRVWVNDWFRQPKVELEKIIQAIDAARSELEARQVRERVSTKSAVQISFVDREHDTLVQLAAMATAAEPYQEAFVSVPKELELHSVPVTRLAHITRQVIESEGPVHFDEVVVRIRSLWGLQRAGNRIRDALQSAEALLLAEKSVVRLGSFLDLPGRAIRVRNRAEVASNTLRKPEFLPPAEVCEAIRAVLRENLGGQRDEIPSATAKLLGFSVVSAQLRQVVLTELDALHSGAEINLRDDVYRLNY